VFSFNLWFGLIRFLAQGPAYDDRDGPSGIPVDEVEAELEKRVRGARVYLKPPPPYPPLVGHIAREHGVTNNLMSHFVRMSAEAASGAEDTVGGGYGEVVSVPQFVRWCTGEKL
jgi:hypothetical protein